MTQKGSLRAVAAVALLSLLTGCGGGGTPSGSTLSQTGTVSYHSFEGGFYAIDADNGQHYDPTNLGTDFAQDGLRVRFQATLKPDVADTHLYGTVIDITQISRL